MRTPCILAIAASTMLILMLNGCSPGKNPVKSVQHPYFTVVIEADSLLQDPTLNTFGFVQSSPSIKTWSIQIDNHNADSVITDEQGSDMIFFGTVFQGLFKESPTSGTRTIQMNTEQGNASANITIPPAAGQLQTPVANDTLAKDSLLITWNGAFDFVLMSVWANGLNFQFDHVFKDTIVTGNSFKIPANRIKDSIYAINISIDGYNGPLPVPGAIGNIQGDGSGFVWATNNRGSSSNTQVFIKGVIQPGQFLGKTIESPETKNAATRLVKLLEKNNPENRK